jgi:hypothetical protein
MKSSTPSVRIAGVAVGAHWSTPLLVALFGLVLATVEPPAMAPGYPTATYWGVAVAFSLVFLGSILCP